MALAAVGFIFFPVVWDLMIFLSLLCGFIYTNFILVQAAYAYKLKVKLQREKTTSATFTTTTNGDVAAVLSNTPDSSTEDT
jgi:hypothetical protein